MEEEGSPPAAPLKSAEPRAVEVAENLTGEEIAELCSASDGSPFLCAGVQSHFYQKFENEQEGRQKALQDMSKRDKMLELMETGEWALEVSLKHSGSLGHFDGEVMWGKNSTDSEYTAAFENQLFDCFRRAHPLGPEGTALAVTKFQQFCETLRSQSITVAFEAVCREILGDHGQLPLLNYLVVTAVVDKAEPFHSRFRDSRRLIEFCTEVRESSLAHFLGHLFGRFCDSLSVEYGAVGPAVERDLPLRGGLLLPAVLGHLRRHVPGRHRV